MQIKEIIAKKRDGEELDLEALRPIVDGFARGDVPDYQMAAFLMAVFFRGMTGGETAILTELMWKSGVTFPRAEQTDFWIDKHSTGGVGDKPSLILVPLVTAVCGRLLGKSAVRIPMVSGRGLGHSGGTLDKLESVPGFSPKITMAHALALIEKNDFFMMGQTEDLAPADRVMYALRDVTGTVESIPLIVSSIMSKKLSENLNGLVFDVKSGNGAFMKTAAQAETLARALVEVAKRKGVDAVALLTRMDEPLGFKVGHSLEVEECADYLRGTSREKGLDEVTLALAASMIHLGSRKKISLAQAHKECESELVSGRAFPIFVTMFEAQGGNWRKFEDHRRSGCDKLLCYAFASPKNGYVAKVEAHAFGVLLNAIGGGRQSTDGVIDFEVGMEFKRKVGDKVEEGEPIVLVFFRDEAHRQAIADTLRNAVHVTEARVQSLPWVLDTLE